MHNFNGHDNPCGAVSLHRTVGGGVETVGLCVGDDGTVEVLGPSLLPLLLMRCY